MLSKSLAQTSIRESLHVDSPPYSEERVKFLFAHLIKAATNYNLQGKF